MILLRAVAAGLLALSAGQAGVVAALGAAPSAAQPRTLYYPVDADGLNALSPFTEEFQNRTCPLVLTPHPGEFCRLSCKSMAEVHADREFVAAEFAARFGVVLLLKGAGTIVTDGRKLYRNSTGNPGMATGGSGDVLTGVIAALLGQKLPPFEAATLGAWVHGRAGDLAAASLGQIGLIAADLPEYLPYAFQELEANSENRTC